MLTSFEKIDMQDQIGKLELSMYSVYILKFISLENMSNYITHA